ncbi:hypothetical protein WOC09_23455 [Vibrio parahaemolyticus]|uniref:hypothetical protein n=1 Tax=Vibrio parahaemolyticus TaxID=670 RepID=UPI00040C24C8|nr:hypothetical protein [Vibrio parahaemolyticus]EGQ8146827.1 hypothetical protein [Vibrio parahaemolyticus]EGQ8340479.1 hypothetical protein [Vibrio parahaemolyticus]EGQ8373165.1 hypothetical protein [Vibrio parahaemolyticus]EGQ8725334.1 hypothetical protein [Vibrio parahaemolyticus]EGQ8764526.1 hypothetical protein [Vibrio parahaemolyticus]
MDEIKNYLELAYYASGICLLLVAYLALGQVKIAQEQLNEQRKALSISSKRDALKLTSEQVVIYGKDIIPLINKFTTAVKKHEIEFFDKSEIVVETDSIIIKPYKDDEDYLKVKEVIPEFVELMNAMEAFAVYFTSGVADESTAYNCLGSSYCNHLKKALPLAHIFDQNDKSYSASMQLFKVWYSRLVAEELELEQKKLMAKIDNLKEQRISIVGET